MTEEQLLRYSRQIKLNGFGPDRQQLLSQGSVLVVGAGGLGSPAAIYLAASGVGTLGLCDGDTVEVSNLARQVMHGTDDVGRSKVDSARDCLARLNPHVRLLTYPCFLSETNAAEVMADYDFVLLCTDTIESKFLLADLCQQFGKPYSYAGAQRYEGQVFTHVPGTATLRDLYGDLPPEECRVSCARTGVLGPACGLIGCIQAAEAIKYLAGTGGLLTDAILSVDALNWDFHLLRL